MSPIPPPQRPEQESWPPEPEMPGAAHPSQGRRISWDRIALALTLAGALLRCVTYMAFFAALHAHNLGWMAICDRGVRWSPLLSVCGVAIALATLRSVYSRWALLVFDIATLAAITGSVAVLKGSVL